jgi:hypothetical protein
MEPEKWLLPENQLEPERLPLLELRNWVRSANTRTGSLTSCANTGCPVIGIGIEALNAVALPVTYEVGILVTLFLENYIIYKIVSTT